MFRFLCLALVSLALVNAEYLYGEQPYVYNTEYASAYDNYKPRDYKFEYGVSDPHTGDHKAQWEVRENGVVRGAYSLLEADGTTRVVEYYADDTGFHADVKKLGTAVHDTPAVAPVVAPVIKATIADGIAYNGYGHGGLEHGYGAPIAAVQHAVAIEQVAPIAKVEHIAPIQQVIAPEIQPLAQYAPIHYQNYAPLLAKAAPVHVAHEYKLEHQVPYPQPVTVNTYHQAPVDKYSPIAAAIYGSSEQGHYVHHAPAPIENFYVKEAPAYPEQQIHFHQQHAAPAPSLYSHEINFAPAQEIKYAAAQEIKYAPAPEIKFAPEQLKYAPAPELKYAPAPEFKYAPAPEFKYAPAPAQEIAYSQELKHAPAHEIAYSQELKHAPTHEIAYSQELKHAPAHEIAYSQEIKHAPAQEIHYAPAQEIKYSHGPVNYAPELLQEVKYTQTPSPIHYDKAPEHYQINYAKENYYQEAKPEHSVQIVHKAAPSADYEALNYFGAAAAAHEYKPEVKYDQYDHQGY